MSKKVNIEDILCEDAGVLKTKDGVATAEILDMELDPIKLSFNDDDCVVIDTSKYQHITLSESNLDTLQKLIDDARDYYDDYFGSEEE